jgi:protein TonB
VENGVASLGQHGHAPLWGAAVAITVHALVGLSLALVPRQGLHAERVVPVEVDLVAPKIPEPLPLPEAPPRQDPPRPIVRKSAVRTPVPSPPPMPNQEVKPVPLTEEPAKAVFGVTQDSVVAGDSPIAVAVGNTLMTKDRTLAKTPPAPLPAAPPPEFAPVDDESVAELPEVIFKSEPVYPEIARRMGIEGKVLVKIGIDHNGNIKSVRVLQKAGYGMDEAALKAAWQHKFRPARGVDGKPVDYAISYSFPFRLPSSSR